MKKILLLLFFLPIVTFSQINLVKNPGFEKYWHCPNTINEIKYANYWHPLSDTIPITSDSVGHWWCAAEYCNACASYGSGVGVPWGGGIFIILVPVMVWHNCKCFVIPVFLILPILV